MHYSRVFIFYFSSLIIYGCSTTPDKKFQVIDPNDSGIHFANTIVSNDTFNVIDFYYIYNGGGVGIGDFNNDGLQDVYFSGNEVANQLYLNKGNFRFDEITEVAGVGASDIWSQGIAIADINLDGWQDIYVCASIRNTAEERINKLFINKGLNKNGIPTFSEEAVHWGIAEQGHSANATFLDYDLDGDLDLFVINNFMDRVFPSEFRPKIVDGRSVNSDKLYRNNGNETFTDVSKEAGILIEGYSHGLSARDLNLDGWPDIYITNDFLPNDILYINNRDGTFTNKISDYLKHQSFSAMGHDIVDVNNDGLLDIMALDMLPEMNYRKKTMLLKSGHLNQMNYQKFNYDYQFIRNMFHLNVGPDEDGSWLFSEIGFLAGIYETDWSWSPLFADFDNDGFKDLVVANGFPGDVTDMDFANYMNKYKNYISDKVVLFDSIPEVKIDNYIFKNNGNLGFTKMTKEWGFEEKTYSNGAAFADFDNDGDLDYITNNINQKSTLYRNNSSQKQADVPISNYLRIRLQGSELNPDGIGAKIMLYVNDQIQFHEHNMGRGFMSAMDPVIHFGLGDFSEADSVVVFWPGNTVSRKYSLASNQEIEIDHHDAVVANPDEIKDYLLAIEQKPIFQHTKGHIPFLHEEKQLLEFNYQQTIPHKLSQYSPSIAVSDIDGDGDEDFYIGGNNLYPGSFMIQDEEGTFTCENRIKVADNPSIKDKGILFFDADGDGDHDLYIVSGGIEKDQGDVALLDRLYLNDGHGYFQYEKNALPDLRYSGSCVKAADFDKDGDLDLFVGTRTIPGQYPFSEASYILMNNNGKFIDATKQICPELNAAEMVTDAIWTDYDNDGWVDLIVVGEWKEISFYKNKAGKLVDASKSALPDNTSGWWNCITGADIDSDGDLDYVCGNLGLNSLFQGTEAHPLTIYAKDFDVNGVIDPIIVKYTSDENFNPQPFPVATRDGLMQQVGTLRQRVKTYREYGQFTIHDLFTAEELTDAYVREASQFQSSILINDGAGKLELRPLPMEAQFAPVFGIEIQDFNSNGQLDILLVGNDYSIELMSGRIDASNGIYLAGNGDGSFSSLKPYQSGFFVKGDAKGIASLVDNNGNELILTTQNKDSLVTHMRSSASILKTIDPKDALFAEIKLKNGKTRKHEFYYGSSYLSQSSRKLPVLSNYESITLFFKDNKQEIIIDF